MANAILVATQELGALTAEIDAHKGPRGTVGADARAVLRSEARSLVAAIKLARAAGRALESAKGPRIEIAATAEEAALRALASATAEAERVRKMWRRTLPESDPAVIAHHPVTS